MSTRDGYPAGVPCWVETLQPEPRAALDFYGPLFGWEFSEPGPMPGGLPGEYYVALLDGREVAGVGSLPDTGGPPTAVWNTRVRVESAGAAVERARGVGGNVVLGPLGGSAVLVDPAGAAFSVWEAGERAGAQVINEPAAWAMSALHTPDPDAAAAFYDAMFGWRSEPMAPGVPITLFRLPGYVGGEPEQPVPRDVVAVMTPTEGGPVPPHWNVNLWVADADAVAAHAADLGGTVLMPPMDTPGFRSAVLSDPQGAAKHPQPLAD